MTRLERLKIAATQPIDRSGLVAFRVLLGVLVTISALRFLAYGWVDELFVKPTFFFKYFGAGWVTPLPAPGMHIVFVAMTVLGLVFASGIAHRVVAPFLFFMFTYVQLIDVANWLNHYYLVSLLLLLSSFMPLQRGETSAPAWCWWLLRFQLGVVYVNAGLAKLSTDWLLHAQPLNIWLLARTGTPVVGSLFAERWVAFAFSWGGFLFDTTIPFFLLNKKTRLPAFAVLVGFHTAVGILFPIGMFPFIMIAGALVFFPPDWPRRLLRLRAAEPKPTTAPRFALPSRPLLGLALAYAVFQVVVPLRHFAYGSDDVAWHEQGMRMSWKVMVREKNGSVTFVVTSPKKGRTFYVDPRAYLTDRQERELGTQPDLILQLAHHVASDFRRKGYDDAEVRAEAMVSLNGRAAVPLIDPNVNLAKIEDGFATKRWIRPAPTTPPIHLRPLFVAELK